MNAVSCDVLVCGVGGQGVMTAADVIAEAALTQGLDCRKSEIAGMSQRGGVVTSHVRFGPTVLSPVISPGSADLLLAFEAVEALRAMHWLKRDGIAVVNTMRLPPPIVSLGLYRYPDDPLADLRRAQVRLRAVDAGEIARRLGDRRLVNAIMLGAAAEFLPFPRATLEALLVARLKAHPSALAELNVKALAAGCAAR